MDFSRHRCIENSCNRTQRPRTSGCCGRENTLWDVWWLFVTRGVDCDKHSQSRMVVVAEWKSCPCDAVWSPGTVSGVGPAGQKQAHGNQGHFPANEHFQHCPTSCKLRITRFARTTGEVGFGAYCLTHKTVRSCCFRRFGFVAVIWHPL